MGQLTHAYYRIAVAGFLRDVGVTPTEILMAERPDSNFEGRQYSPREDACRDTRVAEVDALRALDQFQKFQINARELRANLIEQRNAVGDLLSRLDAAIAVLPDYDTPRGEPREYNPTTMNRPYP